MSPNTGPGPQPKVARVIEKYDLGPIGADLERKWTRSEDRFSLRALADLFNQRLVETALEDAAIDSVTDDPAHVYALLNGAEGSSGQQTQVRRRLERAGVDVKALTDDFVTYQAIRSYLKNHRDASPPSKTDRDVRRTERRTIEQLRDRTAAVTESKLDRLERNDQIRLGTASVLVDVRVFCEDCGRQYDVDELLESGSCACYEG